jgi:cyclophilin family peptidyl-prolyl cis-trans isomerase
VRPRSSTLTLATVAISALALAACGKDDDGGLGSADATATVTQTAPAPASTAAGPVRDDRRTRTNDAGCKAVAAPTPKGPQDLSAPDDRLDRKRTYTAVMQTSCGRIDIRLDAAGSPKTAASFAALARKGFYDDLTFHRVSRPAGRAFVIQGGDPEGTGNGSPGYSVTEKPPRGAKYTRGVVAMAKTEIEDPGTSGSQFFIVTARDSGLPADYAILGRVVGSMEAVDRIGNVATDPTTETPTQPVVIESVEIRESK